MLELVVNPDRYGSRALVPYIVGKNIAVEGGNRLISLPMDDGDESALDYDAERVDAWTHLGFVTPL